jgi:Ubiquitin family
MPHYKHQFVNELNEKAQHTTAGYDVSSNLTSQLLLAACTCNISFAVAQDLAHAAFLDGVNHPNIIAMAQTGTWGQYPSHVTRHLQSHIFAMSHSRSRSRSRPPGAQSSVSPRIPERPGSEECWWDVKVTLVTGVEFQIAACSAWPLKTFKAEICAKTGIPVDEQRLVFEGNLLSLDNIALDGYMLHRQAEVTLLRSKSFKLPVNFLLLDLVSELGRLQKEPAFDIDVEASDTIEAVKAKIQEKEQKEIAFIMGRIDFTKNKLFRLEVGKTLSDYNILNCNCEIWIHCPDCELPTDS